MSRSIILIAALLGACSRQNVDLADRTCGDACLNGFVCNPLTTTCSAALDIGCDRDGAACPDTTATGAPCPAVGAFLPCPGAANDRCEHGGCRICATDNTWSECACADGVSCLCSLTNGGVEICDGLDNDCNGQVDDLSAGAANCMSGELCNGIDDNHDGAVPAAELDHDGDHYVTCAPWAGSGGGITGGGDCNDNDALTHPGATELCDGVDNKCAGSVPADEKDGDSDGYAKCAGFAYRDGLSGSIIGGGDCQPANAKVNPGAPEVFNAADDNCNSLIDECITTCNCPAGDEMLCYQLDDDYTDGSANQNTLTHPGNNFAAGKIGDGYNFTNGQQVYASPLSAYDQQQWTLSAWIKPSSLPSGNNYVIDVERQYGMHVNSSGQLVCALWDTSNVEHDVSTDAGTITTGTFIHIACTYDGTTFSAYINGSLSASTPLTATVRTNQAYSAFIGDAAPDSEQFRGVIDFVQGFHIPHSAAAICRAALRTDCP